jgi:hypothetical protein
MLSTGLLVTVVVVSNLAGVTPNPFDRVRTAGLPSETIQLDLAESVLQLDDVPDGFRIESESFDSNESFVSGFDSRNFVQQRVDVWGREEGFGRQFDTGPSMVGLSASINSETTVYSSVDGAQVAFHELMELQTTQLVNYLIAGGYSIDRNEISDGQQVGHESQQLDLAVSVSSSGVVREFEIRVIQFRVANVIGHTARLSTPGDISDRALNELAARHVDRILEARVDRDG